MTKIVFADSCMTTNGCTSSSASCEVNGCKWNSIGGYCENGLVFGYSSNCSPVSGFGICGAITIPGGAANCESKYSDEFSCDHGKPDDSHLGCTVIPPGGTPGPTPPGGPGGSSCFIQGVPVNGSGNPSGTAIIFGSLYPIDFNTVFVHNNSSSQVVSPSYNFSNLSGNQTVSIDAAPVGWDIYYSACTNSICNGHRLPDGGPYVKSTTWTGSCPNNQYVDLYWLYYCKAPPIAPTNLTNTNPACGSTAITYSWKAVTDVTAYHLTVKDITAGTQGVWAYNSSVCSAGVCSVNNLSPIILTPIIPGHNYQWWVTSWWPSCGTPIPSSPSGAPTFTDPVCVPPALSWFQVIDGDVTTNGHLDSSIPATTATNPYFEMPGFGGFPGIPAYGSGWGTGLISPIISKDLNNNPVNWIVGSSYASKKIYDSSYFLKAIPSDVSVANGTLKMIASPSVNQSDFSTPNLPTISHGYYWYEYDGSIPLATSGDINFGTNKVILIVKNVDLTINGNINLTDGNGFFLAISDSNITVSTTVGNGTASSPNLEGIYIADGNFNTGTASSSSDNQLYVRGSVIAYGEIDSHSQGINLQRDMTDAKNLTTPAETFEFAPDQELLFPRVLSRFPAVWREVAP